MKIIFVKGSLLEKLDKVRILDNMRDEIALKTERGITFSNEATLALMQFPISDAETVFAVVNNTIVKGAHRFKVPSPINWGYSYAEFHHSRYYDLETFEGEELIEKTAEQLEKKDWVCYYISPRELEKIGWVQVSIVPNFVFEVFEKLECEPNYLEENGEQHSYLDLKLAYLSKLNDA